MIEHLDNRYKKDTKNRSGYEFYPQEKDAAIFKPEKDAAAILRFASLLHDIGHVPLSHVGEIVLEKVVKEKFKAEQRYVASTKKIDLFSDKIKQDWRDLAPEKYRGDHTKLHEWLSAEIVLHNEEIDTVLSQEWPDDNQRTEAKRRIAQIIVGKDEMHVPTLLLHSELDADRLDYLLRDSFFTGVGYGKIELDYIISRLCIHRDKKGVATLCVEDKGLHTIEHFILGRFFLQTQVVYNRKVRLVDLLFGDVLKYMVKAGEKQQEWGIMNLQEFLYHIINNKGGGKRVHLHKIYEYTDAEIFVKMRQLHKRLDKRQKKKKEKATPYECYINDCIKIIMDGKIDGPVIAAQRLVDLEKYSNHKKKISEELEEEGNKIAKKIAKKNHLSPERIKVNVVEQEVMKYRKRREAKDDIEEVNKEAVKITGSNQHEWKFAAESNATILRDLHDKALIILNVYYIPSKNAPNAEVEKEKEKYGEIIKREFDGFVKKHFYGDFGCG
jgi:hypothetical protein